MAVLILLSVLCLYFVNADKNMSLAGEVQLEKDDKDKKLSDTSKRPPRGLQSKNMFPVVSVEGGLYYDVTGETKETLRFFKNTQSVEGITATHAGCSVRSLVVETHYILHQDLFTHCPHINLTLRGNRWRCLEMSQMLQRDKRLVRADMRMARCMDAWYHPSNKEYNFKYPMQEGIEKFMEFGITDCNAGKCICKWHFKENSYWISVHCEDLELTDDTLPILPNRTNILRLQNNALRSTEKLVTHLLPYSETLTSLNLANNNIEELPRLPPGSFPHLTYLMLTNNKITKLKIDTFRDLTSRKDLAIDLEGNMLTCNCNLYSFKIFLQQHYFRYWKHYISIMKMSCRHIKQNNTSLVHELTRDECWSSLNWWQNWLWCVNTVLFVLNLGVFFMMIDLIYILKVKKHRRPVIDHLMCLFRRASLSPANTEQCERLKLH